MNKTLLKYISSAAFFSVAIIGILIPFFDKTKVDSRLEEFDLSKITGINPRGWSRTFKAYPLPHLILRNIDLKIKKYVFSTADCNIIKHGYRGRVELFVVFNRRGQIENIILGKNVETPKLIERMRQRGFFQQWNNKSELGEVQYVTGATYSSKAVSGGISELLNLLKRENFF